MTDLSVCFSNWLVMVPAVIEPLTLSAVRPISISGSTEISKATSVTGKPIAGRTISAARVAPPPTPATPAELRVTIPTSVAIHIGSNGLIPTVGATITASIVGYKPAQPFWPIVAPKDAAKLAIDSGIPRRRVCASTLSGIVAALERLVNAKVSTGQTLRKNFAGLTPVKDNRTAWTTNIIARPRYEATTKLPSLTIS